MKTRNCRKCNKIIPFKKVIDGKVRNLANRKFCIECSPFGSRNTKPDIDEPTKRPKGKLYSEWDEFYKQIHRDKMAQKRIDRKNELIRLSGGCCTICGYKRCSRALSFHHREAEEKLFGLSAENLHNRSWDEIVREWKKCILVCLNCHMEIHSPLDNSE
jgi:hypothetical protein